MTVVFLYRTSTYSILVCLFVENLSSIYILQSGIHSLPFLLSLVVLNFAIPTSNDIRRDIHTLYRPITTINSTGRRMLIALP